MENGIRVKKIPFTDGSIPGKAPFAWLQSLGHLVPLQSEQLSLVRYETCLYSLSSILSYSFLFFSVLFVKTQCHNVINIHTEIYSGLCSRFFSAETANFNMFSFVCKSDGHVSLQVSWNSCPTGLLSEVCWIAILTSLTDLMLGGSCSGWLLETGCGQRVPEIKSLPCREWEEAWAS